MGIALGKRSWSALLAGGLLLAVWAQPAAAQTIDDEYSACRDYSGPAGPGNVLRLSTPPTDVNVRVFEAETWICASVDGVGKRVILPVGSPVPINFPDVEHRVATDEDFEACATAPGNEIPGPHPLLDVNEGFGLVDFVLDAYLGDGELWLCYQSNGVPIRTPGLRVRVSFGP